MGEKASLGTLSGEEGTNPKPGWSPGAHLVGRDRAGWQLQGPGAHHADPSEPRLKEGPTVPRPRPGGGDSPPLAPPTRAAAFLVLFVPTWHSWHWSPAAPSSPAL